MSKLGGEIGRNSSAVELMGLGSTMGVGVGSGVGVVVGRAGSAVAEAVGIVSGAGVQEVRVKKAMITRPNAR